MEIREMSVEQLEERKGQIAVELDAEGADLDALETEIRAIKEELEARKQAAEKKAELRKAVAEGSVGEVIKEKIVEDTTMENRTFGVETAEYRNAWMKNLMGKEVTAEERTALTGGSYAIPTQTFNEVVSVFKENKLLSKVSLTNFNTYIRIPVESTANAASWTTTSTDSADALTYCDLNAYQLIKTVEVPADCSNMSVSAFESYIVSQLRNKIETALQAAIINGDGSSKATGIAQTISTATGTFTKAAVTKKDLLKIMGSLDAEFQNGAIWIMPAGVFYEECMNLADHSSFANINDGFNIRLLGHDVVLDSGCTISSTDNIFYGDPKHYRMNLGEAIKVDRDTSLGFRSNSVVYRAVCLADGKLDMAKAFVRYTRATA